MKKKYLALLMAIGLAAGSAACGKSTESSQQTESSDMLDLQNSQTEPDVVNSGSDEAEALTEAGETAEVEGNTEEAAEEELEIHVSVELVERTTEYDSLRYLGGDNIAFSLDGRYGVMKLDGTVVIEPEYSELIPDMQDHCFVLSKFENDEMISCLYDRDLNPLYSLREERGRIEGYSDDIVQIRWYDYEMSYVLAVSYLDAKKDFALIKKLDADTCRGFKNATCFHDGIAVVRMFVWDYEDEELPLYQYIRSNGKGGCDWSVSNWSFQMTYNLPVSENGWVFGDEMEMYESHGAGFYNVVTGAYRPANWVVKFLSGGDGYCTYSVCERAGYALVSTEGKKDDGSYVNLRPYHLESGEFAGEECYQYLDLGTYDTGVMLFQSGDGKSWGYADSNFKTLGRLYEDASGFAGNYALVHLNGGEYVINRDFEFVSNQVAGDSAYGLTDGMFAVYSNGKYHIVEVKE